MRSRVEVVARAAGVGALLLALGSALIAAWRGDSAVPRRAASVLRMTATGRAADSAATVAIRERIVLATTQRASQRPEQNAVVFPVVRAQAVVVPSASVRAVLGAVAHAGMSVTWQNMSGVRALAIDVSRVVTPANGVSITAATTMQPGVDGSSTVVRDAGGILDSIPNSGRLLRVHVARLMPPLQVDVVAGGAVAGQAYAQQPDTLTIGRLRVYAAAGWDSKFVAAALEELGWRVEGDYQIAPKATVRLGVPSTLDTGRYAAVIVMDSGLVTVAALRAFLAQGGGVILAGHALRDQRLLTLASVRIDGNRAAIAGALLTDQPRQGLPAVHLVAGSNVTVLEREGKDAVVTVTRRMAGRVLASGFRESWHWRMEGRDEAASAHREWWNALVAAVAFTSHAVTARRDRASFWPGDAAPLADLVARVGASESLPRADAGRARNAYRPVPSWLLLGIAALALMIEWALRRVRGAP